jgi:hypothetical protein
MPLVAARANAGAFGLGWSALSEPPEELGGMALLTPTSVDITGSGSETATTNPNGSVEFTACSLLRLNGVFSTDYDNYMVSIRSTVSSATIMRSRLSSSGSDEDSASNYYTVQVLYGNGTFIVGQRGSGNTNTLAYVTSTLSTGIVAHWYGPYLTQPTAGRSVTVDGYSNAELYDVAFTHSLSTSYDGFSLLSDSGQTFTGLVSVYGLVGA